MVWVHSRGVDIWPHMIVRNVACLSIPEKQKKDTLDCEENWNCSYMYIKLTFPKVPKSYTHHPVYVVDAGFIVFQEGVYGAVLLIV